MKGAKMYKKLFVILMLSSIFLAPSAMAQIMGDLPTFQGHLTDLLGNPVPDGLIEVRFSIHDAPQGGSEFWSELDTVQVTNGVVTAYLGRKTPINPDLFTPAEEQYRRYLEIKVSGDPPMSPRLLIGGTPTALISSRVFGDIETAPGKLSITDGTSGWFIEQDNLTDVGNIIFALGDAFDAFKDTMVSIIADQSGGSVNLTSTDNVSELVVIAAVDAASMTARSGDNVSELVVIAAVDAASLTAGSGIANWGVYVEETSARIIERMFLDDGTPIMEEEGTAAGGDIRLYDNLGNRVIELHPDGLIEARKGSFGNNNSLNGITTFVVGSSNTVNGNFSIVLGGQSNIASGGSASVVGGVGNMATFGAAFIGGGQNNTASALNSAILGGMNNDASGQQATVSGGADNTASGDYSFAAGRGAQATHLGSFVWSDASGGNFNSAGNNQFGVRASGGTLVYSSSDLSSGVALPPGASQWQIASDRNSKRNIRPVDGDEILANLARLPIGRWSYKTEDPGVEHIGPMAQDFHALFGLGTDDKHISELDPAGVALAGVKELIEIIDGLKQKNAELEARIAELEQSNEK
jgi:hypothetical protein